MIITKWQAINQNTIDVLSIYVWRLASAVRTQSYHRSPV